ncbi:dimethyladenosine transferase [Bifidobacterium aquikefiri]|uniref:Ribosomal RNA small subunit methyltransferase A n=2 Tax=Bifidobacterium aquikefiri TaxID=1653207 RepID=A0A261GBA9_9BIFI|nr:dimethyladenosine transferase [Bifidobacterium aquikefiri]
MSHNTTHPIGCHTRSRNMTGETLHDTHHHDSRLLGASDIRMLAERAGITPTKKLGQNFVIDPGTVRRIVHEAGIQATDSVLEVGPGLGSLTLGILETGAMVNAIEIDRSLARQLPSTIQEFMPEAAGRLHVLNKDALQVTPSDLPTLDNERPFTLVANLPYNVATPVILTLLERFSSLNSLLVMVQKEVADRLVAQPGTKIYGVPSVKLAWYGEAHRAGLVGRNVFWPAPNVDSALVRFQRTRNMQSSNNATGMFAIIDAAFRQRRKTLHAALKGMVHDSAYIVSGIDPKRRGETLTVDEFDALAQAESDRPFQEQHNTGASGSDYDAKLS